MATKKAPKHSEKKRIIELEKEKKQLRKKLEKLENEKKHSQKFIWRHIVIGLTSSLAIVLLILGNLFFWTGRTLTETPRYVKITQPIIQNTDVQNAIANKVTTELFNNINVEKIAQEALPPKAQFLAPSVASQFKTFTNIQAKNLLANSEFQKAWMQINSVAHSNLIQGIKNYNGDGKFKVKDLYNRLSTRITDGPLRFLANKQLPSNIGTITLFSSPNLPKIHWLVVNLWWLRLLTIGSFLLLTILIIYLARNKRRAVMRLMSGYVASLAALLISVRIAEIIVVNKVAYEYRAATKAVWEIVVQSFINQIFALILVGIFVIFVAWLTGNGKHALRVRDKLSLLLAGKAHKALFKKENTLTRWIGETKRTLQIFVASMAILSLIVVSLTVTNVIVIALIAFLVIGLLEIFAAEK